LRTAPGTAGRSPRRRQLVVAGLLIATVLAVSLVNPAFATAANLRDLLVQASPVIIVGCAMSIVILTGEIDISVGSLLGVLAAVMGVLSSPQRLGHSVPLTIGVTLLAGAVAGLVNGLVVTRGRVPSIIATLGMLTILRGLTELLMGGEWITDMPPALRSLGTGTLAGVPVCIWTAALITAISLFVLRRTPLGVRVYAVGGNAEAAAHARISAFRIKLFAFTMTGLFTAIAALVTVPQQQVIESGIGVGFELLVVTAVVVGGTSIRGGLGGIAGTVLAALFLGSIRSALLFLKAGETATYWERAIQGAFILIAVLADHACPVLAARRRVGVAT
jgi:ribose/xylose/arabinose/galactoside ABC-type transport system permease subunit